MTFFAIVPPTAPREYIGFIYKITINDKWYVGLKHFHKGTNWKIYKSSSKEVKELLKSNYGVFEIICYCKTSGELSYRETEYLFKHDALEDPLCLNRNIAGKYFKKNIQKY